MNLDMGLVALEMIYPHLSNESKNSKIGCHMGPGHQFEYRQLLDEFVSGN
jgi:hypothetical protein